MRNKGTTTSEEDLVERIEALEIEAEELREELERLKVKKKTSKKSAEQFPGFQIGDRVQVNTKGKYNFCEGIVHKISATRISFTSDKGQKTCRAPRNLTVISRKQDS